MKYQVMPPLSEEEYAALKADIAERGVQVPVEYDEQGDILDGYHRVKACQELGIRDWPRIVRVGMTEDEKRSHARKLNLARRHLTQEQKRQLIREQLTETPEKSDRETARSLGLDHKTVSAVRKDLAGRGEIPHVVTVIDSRGRRQPRERARKPYTFAADAKAFERATKAVQATPLNALPQKHVEVKRLERIAREVSAHQQPTPEPATRIGVVELQHCDFRDLDLEENSVDLIFTDPPYPAEYLPLWSDLAAFAVRVLKPGRLLVTYSGHLYLPEVIARLQKHLCYVWLGSLVMPGLHNMVHPRHIRTRSKPLLFFSNGSYEPGPWFDDTVFSEGRQKDYHDWQQSIDPARYYIRTLTEPGQLVVDPFLGAGTTAVAAKELGRQFVGCDVDPAAVNAALERVAAV